MKALGINNIGRRASWVPAAVAALVLMAMAPSAFGQLNVLPTAPTGCWRLMITPDAAAKAAGRDAYEEFIWFEGSTFDGQEMARLGFSPGPITPGINGLGQVTFAVTIKSNSSGTIDSSGIYLTISMSGTLKWTKPDGKVYNYTFTGTPYTQDPNVES